MLCKSAVSAKYSRGQNVHGIEGNCIGGIIVKSGCLRTYILSEDGREITLYRLYSDDLCILSASCVLQSITFDVFVDAEEDCEVYIIDGNVFKKISSENLFVENFALNSAVERFSEIMWVMQQILFMSFDKRLAIFLLDESSKIGSSNIRLTHEQIARYMGSAREVVSRMLKYFSSEEIVELYRGEIRIINKNKLRQLTA
jgi:CRP/FNR family transcriptional regulator